jgi:hypothetical protein
MTIFVAINLNLHGDMCMITRKELANLYSVSPNTITKRLKALGINTRERLCPKQLELIYEELGEPQSLKYLRHGAKRA